MTMTVMGYAGPVIGNPPNVRFINSSTRRHPKLLPRPYSLAVETAPIHSYLAPSFQGIHDQFGGVNRYILPAL